MSHGIETVEPREGLLQDIVRKVHHEELRLQARRRFCLALIGFVVSVGALVPMASVLIGRLYTSGFTQFASLLLSDRNVVLAHWQDFGYSLLETLPIDALIVTLCLCLSSLYASRSLLQSSKLMLGSRHQYG